MRYGATLGVALLLCLVVAGCGDDAAEDATTRTLVYLMRGDALGAAARQLPAGEGIEAAAVRAVLDGPTEDEAGAGLTTQLPEGVDVTDVSVADGVVQVDLSGLRGAETARRMLAGGFAQLVFTLTQFPGVQGVRFLAGGEQADVPDAAGVVRDVHRRADWEPLVPAILVERPVVGDVVTSPLRVQGSSDTFEASFAIEVLSPDGDTLADSFATATCGTGCRGTFDVEVPFAPGDAEQVILAVFEPSAADGSRTKEVRIPLAVAAGQ